jgi:HEAT repeat protein
MRQIIYTIGATLLLITVFASFAEGAGRKDSRGEAPRKISTAEKSLLRSLDLAEDANEADIIKLLDDPKKRIFAAGLIRCRKIKAAKDKLLELATDEGVDIFTRIAAAEALCDFENKEWIKAIKPLLTEKRSPIAKQTGLKLDIAGLLARAGDFSQMDFIAVYVRDEQVDVRKSAVAALAHFHAAEDKKQCNKAIDLLMSSANNDDAPKVREAAIVGLEDFIKENKVLSSKYVEILEANAESSDKALQTTCKLLLRQYKR